MTNKDPETLSKLFRQWQAEDGALALRVGELRDWMRQVSQLGIPHFGETTYYLSALRDHLVEHFVHEDGIAKQIAKHDLVPKSEIAALNFEMSRDHESILARIDNLVARLNELEPPFESWQAAMEEVEEIVSILEKHEEREAKTVGSLMDVD